MARWDNPVCPFDGERIFDFSHYGVDGWVQAESFTNYVRYERYFLDVLVSERCRGGA